MREIKFRAWDNVKDKMYYIGEEDDVAFSFDSSGFVATDLTEHDWGFKQLEHLQYMQYTGLKDKNGMEIYEGDVLETDLSRPYVVVVFRNGAFMYQCHDSGKDFYDYMAPADKDTKMDQFLKIIGNIYENPELLEE
jgi:uncharacterized phage protein (TIGR01671 family)